MKNVNLTGLYLALVSEFGVIGFTLSSIVPNTNEPIDAAIDFTSKDEEIEFDVVRIQELVNQNVTDVKQTRIKTSENILHVYIEF